MDDWLPLVESRVCGAWPLPGDATCAGLARRTFRRVAGALGLDPEVTDDGVTMVSELAANTLHAQAEQGQQPGRGPRAPAPELWLYLRGAGPRRELVCKVFDSFRGWVHGTAPAHGPRPVAPDATSGRGLEVVHELSRGRWGYHPTRARLAGPGVGEVGVGGLGVGGKAVWFSVPAATAPVRPEWMPASAAMTEFEEGLTARGLEATMVRADDSAADIAVLAVHAGLTAWCWCGTAWLHAPGLVSHQWGYCDLVEVTERAVEAYESLTAKSEPAPLGPLVHALRE